MKLVFFLSLVEIAFGMALVQCFIPRPALGPGFGKTISASIFFCLLGPALVPGLFLPPSTAEGIHHVRLLGLAALAVWFAYFVLLNYENRQTLQRTLVVLATGVQAAMIFVAALVLALHYVTDRHVDYRSSVNLIMLSLVPGIACSGMALGTINMAMLIGHWYLVDARLDIVWLKSACLVSILAIVFKIVSMALSLAIGISTHPFGYEGFRDGVLLPGSVFFMTRLIVGIALPLLLCVMAWRAAVIRSTQSSTGILFPALIIALLGEMIGAYLLQGTSGLAI